MVEQTIRVLLQGKGIEASEQDYPILAALWQSILTLKGDASQIPLKETDIALYHMPGGGGKNEQ